MLHKCALDQHAPSVFPLASGWEYGEEKPCFQEGAKTRSIPTNQFIIMSLRPKLKVLFIS